MPVLSAPAIRPRSVASNGGAQAVNTRTKVAWIPDGELEFPQWTVVGRHLGSVGRCSQWWVGDWVRYGTSRWGEKYAEAARITGYDPKSLRNLAYVAARFDLSRRRDNLSWSHHAELAVLDLGEQDRWLDLAIDRRLSVSDLRVELRAFQRGFKGDARDDDATNRDTSSDTTLVCPHCGGDVPLPPVLNERTT